MSNEKTTIYFNPRCGTCRKTLELLRAEAGVEPEVVEYLKQPPTKDEIKTLLKKLKLTPRDIMRKRDKLYDSLRLDTSGLPDESLIDALTDNPQLLERPIVVRGDKAVVARPAEKIFELF